MRILLAISIAACCALTLNAQGSIMYARPFVNGEEMKLLAPPRDKLRELNPQQCGAYVVRLSTPQGPRVGVYSLLKNGAGFMSAYPQETFRTVIDDTKSVPTVSYFAATTLTNGSLNKRGAVNEATLSLDDVLIVVKISQKEYDRAAGCLPPPRIHL